MLFAYPLSMSVSHYGLLQSFIHVHGSTEFFLEEALLWPGESERLSVD